MRSRQTKCWRPATTPNRPKKSPDFRRFIEENKDELTALQILYARPYAQRHLSWQAVKDLRDAMARPPWLLQPIALWACYRRLNASKVRDASPASVLTDLVALVRYALGHSKTLQPLSAKRRRTLQPVDRPRKACWPRVFPRADTLADNNSRSCRGERRGHARRPPGGAGFRRPGRAHRRQPPVRPRTPARAAGRVERHPDRHRSRCLTQTPPPLAGGGSGGGELEKNDLPPTPHIHKYPWTAGR